MTRKRLPKAITRTVAERHEADADEVTSEELSPKPPRRQPAPRRTAQAKQAAASSNDALGNDAANEAAGKTEPRTATGELLPPPEAGPTVPRNEERRRAAEKIVDRYKVYAALGGLVPMPVINLAGLTAVNMRMVKALCDLYELPFESNQTRAIIMGLIGGSVPTGLGFATASLVGLVLPAGAFVGLAAASASAIAMTRGIGLVFVEYFEQGAMPPAATPSAPAQHEP
jgi:uncharacterized protein (DUF697 family)